MVILLLGTHLYLTIILKFPQRKLLKGIRLTIARSEGNGGDVSQFGAMAISLAATIGTGNIIGVATAVSLGGPGAVFWCWIVGVFGISTKYAEALLAVKYRRRNENGTIIGGPMCVLDSALGMRPLAIFFSIFTVMAAFGLGGTVQANAISVLVKEDLGISPYISGALLAACVGAVVIFGVKGIAKMCTRIVPSMAIVYLLGCVYILCANHAFLGQALSLIVRSAFDPSAVGGGFAGATIAMTMRYGIARGLFSNESGLGSAPIVAAAANTRNPVRQALVSSTSVFWDTVVVCAITGLVLVSSVLAYPDINFTDGATLTKHAFDKIPYIGSPILIFAVVVFAFSTIVGWSYYAERAVEYLGGKRVVLLFRVVWVVVIYIGSTVSLNLVWNISDITNALMAIPNIISLLLLSRVLIKDTNYYLWGGKIDEAGGIISEQDNAE